MRVVSIIASGALVLAHAGLEPCLAAPSTDQAATSQGLVASLLTAVPGVESFFAEFWQRRPAVIRRGNPAFFQRLITSDDLNAMVALCTGHGGSEAASANSTGVEEPSWRLVKRARGADGEWWSSSPPAPPRAGEASEEEEEEEAEALRRVELGHRAFDQGFSLVLNAVDQKHRAVGWLAQAFEEELALPTGVNVYMTPGGSQAFEGHFDWMDSFVLQVEGRKRWRLYDALVEQPRPDMKFKLPAAEAGEPFVDFTLEAGDMLYIPSGLIHEADTAGMAAPSMHLTVGVESTVVGSYEALLLDLVLAATEGAAADALPPLACPGDAAADAPLLTELLAAPVGDAHSPLPTLKMGDLVTILLVHLAAQERSLRQAVPLAALAIQGAGGGAAVVAEVEKVASRLQAGGSEAAEAALRALVSKRGGKLPRPLQGLGGKGLGDGVQRRIAAATAEGAAPVPLPSPARASLERILARLACALAVPAQAQAVLQRFEATTRASLARRRRQREQELERAAARIASLALPRGFKQGAGAGRGEL